MSDKAKAQDSLRVALVCDWLTTPGGAEKVLLELHRMYPEAPIYTSQYRRKGISWFDDAEVRTGWLQIFPAKLRKILGPLRQLYFSHLDLSSYDLVISVTGAEAKAVRTVRKKHSGIVDVAVEDADIKNGASDDSEQATKHLAENKGQKNRDLGFSSHKNPERPRQKHSSRLVYHTISDLSIGEARRGAFHLCYCHVPTQYYWQMYDKYVENPGFGFLNPLVRGCFKLLVKPLRKADYRAAQQPDQFVAISEYAKEQIETYYHREALVVAPPVEVGKFHQADKKDKKDKAEKVELLHKFSTFGIDFSTRNPQTASQKSTESEQFSTQKSTKKSQFSTKHHQKPTTYPQLIHNSSQTEAPLYYIIACRQVTWKRVDLAIRACQEAGLPLLVVGDGSEHRNLVKLAAGSPLIQFLPWAKTEDLALYLRQAKGYIFPSLEPFGVAAVEALAAGCPVIAYREGGSRDFVQEGKNGVLFDEQTVASLVQALQKFERLKFDRKQIAQTAEPFDAQKFRQQIRHLVDSRAKIKE